MNDINWTNIYNEKRKNVDEQIENLKRELYHHVLHQAGDAYNFEYVRDLNQITKKLENIVARLNT